MKLVEKLFTWKITIQLSIVTLVALSVLNFYGLYTQTFPVFRPENFAFPIIALVHLVFLYVLWFKITEYEDTDPQMRTLEYILYAVVLVYLFYLAKTVYTLLSYTDFENHVIPVSFLPMALVILVLQVFLIFLTVLAIGYRRKLVGDYNFDDISRHIDSWEQ
tara:strand:+ start:1297 stop:1782 length:486 start_codon:yes stop_codon:yes gene_type:complete